MPVSHVGPRLYTTSLENTNKRGESETQGSPFPVFVDSIFTFWREVGLESLGGSTERRDMCCVIQHCLVLLTRMRCEIIKCNLNYDVVVARIFLKSLISRGPSILFYVKLDKFYKIQNILDYKQSKQAKRFKSIKTVLLVLRKFVLYN